jgi:hypothetical protein
MEREEHKGRIGGIRERIENDTVYLYITSCICKVHEKEFYLLGPRVYE